MVLKRDETGKMIEVKVPGEVIEEGVNCPHCPRSLTTQRQDPRLCNHKDADRYQIIIDSSGKPAMKKVRTKEDIKKLAEEKKAKEEEKLEPKKKVK